MLFQISHFDVHWYSLEQPLSPHALPLTVTIHTWYEHPPDHGYIPDYHDIMHVLQHLVKAAVTMHDIMFSTHFFRFLAVWTTAYGDKIWLLL